MLRPLRVRIPAALLAALYLAVPGGAVGVRPCLHHDGLVPESAISEHTGADAGRTDASRAEPSHADASHAGAEAPRGNAHDHAQAVSEDDASRAHDDTHDGCSCLEACAAGTAIALDAVAPVVPVANESVARSSLSASDAPRAVYPSHFLPFATAPPVVPV